MEARQVPPGLGRRRWEAREGWTLLSLPSGSRQVSGPNPVFTDSQEIQEIRVTSVTALSYLVAKESPPSLTPPLFLSWRLPEGHGAQECSGERSGHHSQAVSWAGLMPGRGLQAFEDRVRGGKGAGLPRYWA